MPTNPRERVPLSLESRATLVRRGVRLTDATIGYNSFEALASLIAGVVSGSPALVGFGVDSLIELTSSVAARWRLRADHDRGRREHAERITARIVGYSFLLLAVYLTLESGMAIVRHERPDRSVAGIVILALSVVVMPVLARGKRRVAVALESRALESDATQTSLCAYLSAIALAGVALNVSLGWWWADPAAALAMCPIIVREGLDGVRGESRCDDCR